MKNYYLGNNSNNNNGIMFKMLLRFFDNKYITVYYMFFLNL